MRNSSLPPSNTLHLEAENKHEVVPFSLLSLLEYFDLFPCLLGDGGRRVMRYIRSNDLSKVMACGDVAKDKLPC